MDPSTSAAQDVQNQKTADQPVNSGQQQTQSTQPVAPPQPKTQQISVGNVEAAGASAVIQESADADADDDDEDELLVAPQETKNRAVSQGGMADIQEDETENQVVGQGAVANLQEEAVEIQPAVPEVATRSVEVEKVIEKSPDLEKPDIPKALSDAGVTHSGPGVINVQQNNFGVTKMPVTYQQAIVEEKVTKLHDSKHWLMGMVMYIWRKLHPELGKNGKTEMTQKKGTLTKSG